MALPGLPLSSAELLDRIARNFGVSPRLGAAIGKRLGVLTRYHSRDWQLRLEAPRIGARNPELAAMAVADALAEAGLPVASLQYLLSHTTTPASLLPPNVAEIADRLGHAAPYAEFRQASTGFASALVLAAGMMAEPGSAPIAIVGSEVGSVFCDPLSLRVDPGQWVNIMQMSDGAAAVVLGPDDGRPGPRIELAFYGHIGLDRKPAFTLDEGGSDYPAVREGRAMATFHCDFERVKRDAPELYRAAFSAARDAGIELDRIAMIVPHQAHGNAGRRLARAMNLPTTKFFGNGERVGNLGNASMWAALHELRGSTLLAPGDRVLCIGVEASHYLYGGFVYVHA
ncbi:MAG: ketoacyl-ACP synthase III [Nevskia sp.]